MELIIGSKNPAKINAAEAVFPSYQVTAKDVPSNVAAQPITDEETRQGAINRAQQCMQSSSHSIGIGLEGGVMRMDKQIYVCNWGALLTQNGAVFTASGARIALPEAFGEPLYNGVELGDIMDDYAKKLNVRQKEGAVGIFTNDLISRQEMFVHVVKLLRGQWEYWDGKSDGN